MIAENPGLSEEEKTACLFGNAKKTRLRVEEITTGKAVRKKERPTDYAGNLPD